MLVTLARVRCHPRLRIYWANPDQVRTQPRRVGRQNGSRLGHPCLPERTRIAGTFTVGVGFLLWVAVLSRLDLSQAMPLLALTYVPWLIIAHWVLREEVTLPQWIGVALVSVGGSSSSASSRPRAPARSSGHSQQVARRTTNTLTGQDLATRVTNGCSSPAKCIVR